MQIEKGIVILAFCAGFGFAAQEPPQDHETGLKQDPRLIVQPVNEPDMPLEAREGENLGYIYWAIPKKSGFVFERKGADKKTMSGVVVPGRILVTRGPVELFGCGEGGKEHETIIRVECDIQQLDLAFALAGFKPGELAKKLDINEPGQGSRLLIFIQWNDKDGKVVTRRSEDLVISARREKPMPRVGWTYVGGWSEVPDATGKTHKILDAVRSRSLVTTWRNTKGLLDNPLPEGADDTLFAANYMVLPDSRTPVRIIFRLPSAAEHEEIARLETELNKEPPPKPRHHHGEERK